MKPLRCSIHCWGRWIGFAMLHRSKRQPECFQIPLTLHRCTALRWLHYNPHLSIELLNQPHKLEILRFQSQVNCLFHFRSWLWSKQNFSLHYGHGFHQICRRNILLVYQDCHPKPLYKACSTFNLLVAFKAQPAKPSIAQRRQYKTGLSYPLNQERGW